MTAAAHPARSRSWIPIVVLAGIAIVGAVVGAYLDWMWWHPTSGIVVTIGAIGLLLIGAVAMASRWQPIRPVAYGVLAFAIGAILGQNLGPSRPPISLVDGTVTLELTQPADAAPVTGPAYCQLTPAGDNFEITGDPNLRLQIGDQPLQERDPIQVAVGRGDMWEYGVESRADGWSLLLILGDAGPFTDEEVPTEVAMASDASSELTGSGDQRAGSIGFSGLAPKNMGLGAGERVELAGTLSWTCEGPAADPER